MNPTLSELEAKATRRKAAFGGDAHIVCDNLVRIYKTEGVEVVALQGLDLVIDKGELVAIVGASGSGKSTLLNVLSGLDVPTAGVARVAGTDLLSMNARDRLRYRRSVVGFIWQQTARNLLPYLTARENVELPTKLAGGRRERRERAGELLELLGVGYCANRRTPEMSGGEQQRVAIAVALANSPQLVLADEPTGELDSETSELVFDSLRKANRELGVTVVVVTHDPLVSEQVDRTVGIRDGRTSSETLRREDAEGQIIAEEYAVLDRVGRLQLPRDFMNALDMERRVRLELESDHIGVWPAREEPSGE
ncbi:ABC transporter ATP-binding protein [Nonomuraea sp. KC401]|uniref:ABC transporter ATP-binding protein n=1 Tax=unclassified Nonomuraea TaxID=2593643 RepID=UPI0010FF29C4|nr:MULTISPECIES: ABC transporter ATP-binding protein [unclassified Nonomuraea]NBE99359.1 ATP-binding cassette domain-containing protein [Nonomuraea sp. K271]TLF60933.1 ABC transporter ATP-binding protein [Nonomuraea sp. KC401]